MRRSPSICVVALVLGCAGSVAAQENAEQWNRSSTDQRTTEAQAPFEAFVRALGRDLARLPSKETALTLGLGGAFALAVHPRDARLTHGFRLSPTLDHVLEAGEALGSGWTQAGGAAVTFLTGQIIRQPRMRAVGADMLRAQTINAALTQGLKLSIRRARPDGAPYSFPSGHASASFANATVLHRHFGWKVGIPAYAAAAYVATSRLQENRHYASDVIFGAAVGIVAGRTDTSTITIGRGSARFAVVPVAGRGTAALAFVRVMR